MAPSKNPLLYQINARVTQRELSDRLGRPATLDDIPDALLAELRATGFEWLYLLGAWQTGAYALNICRTAPHLLEEYRRVLHDLKNEDIVGSCFAVTGYTPHADLGGEEALRRLHERANHAGLKLMLDFVPNHVATDHPWVAEHPEYLMPGTPAKLAREPMNYMSVSTPRGPEVFAHGRDPYFPGWSDTLQVDYSKPETIAAMQGELLRAAQFCDGLRCDMAMLILPAIFKRTWGKPALPFWHEAIARVKAAHPGFHFMAEVYWDLEPDLLKLGFDSTYDKRLYDYLRDGQVDQVKKHLRASQDHLTRMAHFLENHDEQRAAAVFGPGAHQAAAVILYGAPGVRFFHQGQLEGKKVKIPVQLNRGPGEPVNAEIQAFYHRLIETLRQPVFSDGDWRLVTVFADEEAVETHPAIVAYEWRLGEARQVVVANDSPLPVEGWFQRAGMERVALPAYGYTFIPPMEK